MTTDPRTHQPDNISHRDCARPQLCPLYAHAHHATVEHRPSQWHVAATGVRGGAARCRVVVHVLVEPIDREGNRRETGETHGLSLDLSQPPSLHDLTARSHPVFYLPLGRRFDNTSDADSPTPSAHTTVRSLRRLGRRRGAKRIYHRSTALAPTGLPCTPCTAIDEHQSVTRRGGCEAALLRFLGIGGVVCFFIAVRPYAVVLTCV